MKLIKQKLTERGGGSVLRPSLSSAFNFPCPCQDQGVALRSDEVLSLMKGFFRRVVEVIDERLRMKHILVNVRDHVP